MTSEDQGLHLTGVAVIGMAGRFPGARDLTEFWKQLASGKECITFFDHDAAEVRPRDPYLVRAGGLLQGAEEFDATFFGYSPREAELIDPQQRIFLEAAHACIEGAGYDSSRYRGMIGVYAGASLNRYLFQNVLPSLRDKTESGGGFQALVANSAASLATRVAYELNLRGPSMFVQSACSTSLLAIHLACQDLLGYRCDMAVAGGVSVNPTPKRGYRYIEDGVFSPDGHCRAFDATGKGTLPGSGVGAVLLKRLEDAIDDGDPIRAVIRGSAANNDGAMKVSFTAPSVQGQSEVILLAQTVAETPAETIGYVEGHGTGTPLGDPIEVQALTRAFRASTSRNGFCALGSVKSNVGHLDAAAGVTSFIKTVLALEHGQIPPSLHFETPNPEAGFPQSPFYVCTQLTAWPITGTPRRAGVSSFGIGGTNVHVVLEQAPAESTERRTEPGARPYHLLPLSAKSVSALQRSASNLAERLENDHSLDIADVAYTLQNGRKGHEYRFAAVSENSAEAARLFWSAADLLDQATAIEREPPVYLLFPGAGTQYLNAGRDLYECEPVFRQIMQQAHATVAPLGVDLLGSLYGGKDLESADKELRRPSVQFPAIVAVEYALAQLLFSCGVRPDGLMGHSLGEYTAACVSGVLEFEDLLRIVVLRGRLFERVNGAATLNVRSPEQKVVPLLPRSVAIAAVNSPDNCAVSGPQEAIAELELRLAEAHIDCKRLHGEMAAHCPMLDPVLAEFRQAIAGITLREPKIPYVSNVTGNWITAAEAMSPDYWTRHMRQTVQFMDGLGVLLERRSGVFIEAGPGQGLSRLIVRHPSSSATHRSVSVLRSRNHEEADTAFFLHGLGQIWCAGVSMQWEQLYSGERRRRVSLPSYPFESIPFWIEAPNEETPSSEAAAILEQSWRRAPSRSGSRSDQPGDAKPALFSDLPGADENVIHLPANVEMFRKWIANGNAAKRIGILCSESPGWEFAQGLIGELAAALPAGVETIQLYSRGRLNLLGTERPAGTEIDASFSHACFWRTLQTQLIQAFPGQKICLVDLPSEAPDSELVSMAIADLRSGFCDEVAAYRGRYRWTWTSEPASPASPASVRLDSATHGGKYLIAGGTSDSRGGLTALLQKVAPGATVITGAGPGSTASSNPNWELAGLAASFASYELAARNEHPVEKVPDDLKQGLDRLCTLYVLEYFQRCGIKVRAGERYDISGLERQLCIAPAYAKLFRTFLNVLVADGALRAEGSERVFEADSEHGEASALSAALKKQFEDYREDLETLERVTPAYPEVLSGRTDANEVLFPAGNYEALLPLSRKRMKATNAEAYVALTADCVLELAKSFPDRPLRILEVGGGEGFLTWPVVEKLRGQVPFEYVFTDVGRSFVMRAEREARRLGMEQMVFRTLDFLEDPAAQGVGAESFDLILAFNVVHVAADVRDAVRKLSSLLTPGGCLCLLEGTIVSRPAMLFWGLETGWWNFSDSDLRQHSPLLSRAQWETVLCGAGFPDQVSFPPADQVDSDYALLIAQKPSASAVLTEADHFLDGVFWLQKSGWADERNSQTMTDWLTSFRCASADLETLEDLVSRCEAQFCCILSPNPNGSCDFESRVASLAADEFVTERSGAGGARWSRILWDSLLSRPSSVSDGETILRVAMGSEFTHLVSSQAPVVNSSTVPQYQVLERRVLNSNRRPPLRTPFVAPRTKEEEGMARIWEEILGIQGLGIHDNFFELGGESLLGTQLTSRIREQYRIQLPLRDFFKQPTIAGVSDLLERSATGEAETSAQSEEIIAVTREARRAKRSADGLIESGAGR